jgi:hypothetical protein
MSRGRCWYCGATLHPFKDFVVEHVVPLCRGGNDDITNLVPSCSYCNQSKGAKLLSEWLPRFADENGQGSNPLEWCFWFQVFPGEYMPGDGPRTEVKEYTREEWRSIVITGHLVEEDCAAQGGC